MRHKPTTPLQVTCEQCSVLFIRHQCAMAKRVFCSRACAAAGRTTSLAERFWSKVNKNGPVPEHRPELGACWIWTASTRTDGYGAIGAGGKRGKDLATHRVSWTLTFGPVPDGLWVLHRCDVRRCIRPDHLFLGTDADNKADMVAKGRAASGERSGPRLHPGEILRGEQQPNAKLTEEQVRSLRARYAQGDISQRALARIYGIGQAATKDIILKRRWAHIN